jgi:hypothetical protein
MLIKKNLQRGLRHGFGAPILLAVLIAGALEPGFAARANRSAFDSAEQAVDALYIAVKNDNQLVISRLIGPLASSDDIVRDKADREQFLRKYSEMHRLVRKPDGITMLYIGAENWPFPVPLISSNGKWGFDLDAGAQEIVFRRIGENETAAIDTCRAIAVGTASPSVETLHGYRFRMLRNATADIVVAYPSEYGSTGLMTIAVTAGGAVYEKDLGRKTVQLVHAMTQYKPDRTWRVAEQ